MPFTLIVTQFFGSITVNKVDGLRDVVILHITYTDVHGAIIRAETYTTTSQREVTKLVHDIEQGYDNYDDCAYANIVGYEFDSFTKMAKKRHDYTIAMRLGNTRIEVWLDMNT